ncbi:transposase [Chryseobacterium sp. RP-3-3]|uniref:Transposase n=1 Tax=Chryseobacterium antibioticum TaxID=2728847 RepID=A0A7Y0AKJ5_9FLAO|nr:transposase [Chryseobacterium antibioticum]NML69068.1 transposase [Chryseobacterium antibioticum]
METNFRDIHIGNYIREHVKKHEIPLLRICNFFKTTEEEIIKMYEQESLDTNVLLKWSKLLEYDFFRLYVTHLLLYDGISHTKNNKKVREAGEKMLFRKNIYNQEIKEFLIELITSNQKTVAQVIQEYNIPRTTIYKWIRKVEKN